MNPSKNISTANSISSLVNKSNLIYAIIQIAYMPLIIFGNFLVITSILLFFQMRHHTNYIMFSLACADLVVGAVTCPFYITFYLNGNLFYDREACLTWFGSFVLGCGASLYNLLIFVIDRFLAICYPICYQNHKRFRNVVLVLILTWVYVIVLSTLPLLGWNNFVENKRCNFYQTLPKPYVIWVAHGTIGICTLPSVVMYIIIAVKVRRFRNRIFLQQQVGVKSDSTVVRFRKEIYISKVVAALFIIFVLFWTPYFIVGPFKYSYLSQDYVEVIKNGTLVLAFSHSLVNPVVYYFTRKKFRIAFILLLSTKVTCWHKLRNFNFDIYDYEPTRSVTYELDSQAPIVAVFPFGTTTNPSKSSVE